MATDDREIFVETQYPAPPYVDGITRVVTNPESEDEGWINAKDVSDVPSGTSDEIATVPSPIAVIEQKVVTAKGGGIEISAILVIQEIPSVEDYEIRLVMR